MVRKLVYVDIGTHKGQEYKALFCYSVWEFLYRFIKLFVASFILRKNKINTIGPREAFNIINSVKLIRRQKGNITTVLVEPNIRLYRDEVYRSADKVFCIALGDMDDGMHFSNLFFPNSDKISQGASIFSTKENIDFEQTDNVIVCGCVPFAKMLKESLDGALGKNSYEVVIRINCEGSEDTGIYAFHKVFKNQFNVIFGSLKDVGELKGSSEMQALWTYINRNDLKFVPFTPLYTTWKDATREMLDILELSDKL
tara:strand:+ start:876 stop:1640 length:765 start_codon:yes stop_codon:yes gene_type:complete